ncbi:MAG: 30S ribosomal protein S19e, partial [Candidatus Woesearchaeota archaeon]
MATIYDVDPNMLIERAAKELEKAKIVSPPAWSIFAKTGVHKSRVPARKDWWYVRSAAVLRTVYRLGPIGTQKLRTKYGGREDRGYKPETTKKGSGSIIRKILQQLEKSGFVKQVDKYGKKGRIATPKGKSFLDKIASQILKENPPKKLEPLKITFEESIPIKEEE